MARTSPKAMFIPDSSRKPITPSTIFWVVMAAQVAFVVGIWLLFFMIGMFSAL